MKDYEPIESTGKIIGVKKWQSDCCNVHSNFDNKTKKFTCTKCKKECLIHGEIIRSLKHK